MWLHLSLLLLQLYYYYYYYYYYYNDDYDYNYDSLWSWPQPSPDKIIPNSLCISASNSWLESTSAFCFKISTSVDFGHPLLLWLSVGSQRTSLCAGRLGCLWQCPASCILLASTLSPTLCLSLWCTGEKHYNSKHVELIEYTNGVIARARLLISADEWKKNYWKSSTISIFKSLIGGPRQWRQQQQ